MNQLFDLLTFSRLRCFRINSCWVGLILGLVLSLGLVGCQGQPQISPIAPTAPIVKANLSEVSAPTALEDLNEWFDQYQPQVEILSPRPNEVLPNTQVSLRIAVKNLPLFRDLATGLGPYLQVTLDNQASRPVYSSEKPIVIEDLAPGTHTLRVVAVRPWGESFKTAGAYAQVTFHTLVESNQNNPRPQRPLLTYNQPQGFYGSEPFLLDFYLSNVPLSAVSSVNAPETPAGWQVRCTINGTSFTVDRWQPFYLTGLKPGQNWVRLELLDGQGRPIENVFNPTTWVVDYQPGGQDTRSRLLRGELTAAEVKGILSPQFESALPKLPTPEPSPMSLPPETVPLESTPEPVSPTDTSAQEVKPDTNLPPSANQLESQALEENSASPVSEIEPAADLPPPPEDSPTLPAKSSGRSWRNFFRQQPTPPGLDQETPPQPLSAPEETQETESTDPELETSSPKAEVDRVPNFEPKEDLEDLKKRWQSYLSRPAPSPSPAPALAPEPAVTITEE